MDTAHLNEYLHNAIFGNSLTAETAKHFIDNRGDVNQRDKGRRTPLHYYADNFQIAKLLIDAGADVNAGDCDGKTPLFEAHLEGNVCKYLIEKGCNVNLRDKKGRTPLLYYAVHHYASARDGFAENYPEANFQIAKLLIEAGADVNGSARIGIKIPSSKKVDPEIRQYLIEKGVITQN